MLNKNEILILHIFKSMNELKYKKRIQKMIYLCKTLGYPFDEDFTYHYYGPYSFELASEIDNLVELKMLEQTENKKEMGSLFKITKDGREIVKREIGVIAAGEYSKLFKLIKEMNGKSPGFLEVVSTIEYLRASNYDNSSILTKINELKSDAIKRENIDVSEAINYKLNVLCPIRNS